MKALQDFIDHLMGYDEENSKKVFTKWKKYDIFNMSNSKTKTDFLISRCAIWRNMSAD